MLETRWHVKGSYDPMASKCLSRTFVLAPCSICTLCTVPRVCDPYRSMYARAP